MNEGFEMYEADDACETHVTVRCRTEEERAGLGAWAAERGLKLTTIVLARGRTPIQPMLTLPDRTSHPAVVDKLREAGFEPVRVKVETVPWSTEPVGPGGGYYEHHLKLALPAAYDRAALEALVMPLGAHVSWNARRVLPGPGGRHERFVTQRHLGPADAAGRACDALVATLIAAGHELVAQERELVLSDSDLSLDDGWLDEGGVGDGGVGDGGVGDGGVGDGGLDEDGLDENQLGESRLGKGWLQEAV